MSNLFNNLPIKLHEQIIINKRLKKYYQLLNKWLKLQQNKYYLSDYFLRNKYLNVAIYGFGEIGKNLIEELKSSSITINCLLVQNKENNYEKDYDKFIKILCISEFLHYQKMQNIDAIIISPIYDYSNVRKMLTENNITCPIISLEDVVEECYKEAFENPNLQCKIEKLEIQINELKDRLETIEEIHPQTLWLYNNSKERMDANVEIFPLSRRLFHKERYNFAANYVSGKIVVDIACGTGYGTEILKIYGKAEKVIGVDIDTQAIEYAILKYKSPEVNFICASGAETGLDEASIDVVVSFETIEHVPDDKELLKEFIRILKPGGILICSTPNNWPLTAFHVRNYDRKSFEEILNIGFTDITLYNQNSGSNLPRNHGQKAGITITTNENQDLAECYIAVCKKR